MAYSIFEEKSFEFAVDIVSVHIDWIFRKSKGKKHFKSMHRDNKNFNFNYKNNKTKNY